MLKRIGLGLVFFLAICSFGISQDQKDKTMEELKKLEGTWTVEKAELGGADFPEELRKSVKLIMKGNTYKVTVGANEDEGTSKIDLDKKPKTMDITGTKGPNAGKTILAIYELSGDTLKVCYALEGERPTEFKSPSGTSTFLATYKREK